MKQGNKLNRVDKGWGQMNDLLDKKMPQKKERKRIIILFFLIGLLFTVSSLAYVANYKLSKNTDLQNKKANVQVEDPHISENAMINLPLTPKDKLKRQDNINPNSILKSSSNVENSNTLDFGKDDVTILEKITTTQLANKKPELQNQNVTDRQSITTKISQSNTKKRILKVNNDLSSEEPKTAPIEKTLSLKTRNEITQNIFIKELVSSPNINSLPIWRLSSTTDNADALERAKLEKYLSLPPFVDPIKNIWQLNAGILAYANYLTDFEAYGYEGGLFIEMQRNHRWGFGLKASYQNASITPTDRQLGLNSDETITSDLEAMIDFPSTGIITNPDENTVGPPNVIEESKRGEILQAYTTNFNAFKAVGYTFYKPSSATKIILGLGINKFINSRSLNDVYIYDPNTFNNRPSLTTVLFKQSKITPIAEIGFNFNIFKNLSSSINYSHAFSNLINESNLKLRSNTVQLGLSFTF